MGISVFTKFIFPARGRRIILMLPSFTSQNKSDGTDLMYIEL